MPVFVCLFGVQVITDACHEQEAESGMMDPEPVC